ncbi:MAG: LPS-assembly protein LptD [Prevotella sp.]|jgi:lipopolysaccharide assembly outer membrane protein LptD (OstA)|nr:LPS-assembly protein LptD [Prevotella sp.]
MRKIRVLTYVFLCILFSAPFLGAQYAHTKYRAVDSIHGNDTLPRSNRDSLPKNDSLKLRNDSLPEDSTKQKKNALDAIVDYTANDSIVLAADNWGYLYGSAEVKYTDITLKSEKLSMNMDSSLVYATFGTDSTGNEFGYPVFSDGDTDYESKNMTYNFKTGKGYSTNIVTTQGEGYVMAGKAKKQENNSFFMLDGKYTTCDDHEHPHFFIAMTKALVNPNKNVVTGPAYLVIEGLPLPIGLPFGFFPFSDKYSSGVIMPSYGDEMDRGFNLHDGGYYFAFNDNVDLSLTGDIYTKGSWGLKARSSYRKRYKYSGSFDFNYLYNKYGEKDIDQTISKDLSINWTHTQDPKANMFRTLSASVNFSTSSYNQNSLDNKYTRPGTSNTKGSSVTLTRKIPNSAWSLSASMNVAQRSQDSSISMTLPNLTVTMSRIAPFKRKEAAGAERWYEKIQMSYTGDFRNSIDTKENLLLKSNLQKDWKNAMKHTIPVSATFSAFNYLNITPSMNYTERWYTRKISKRWNPQTNAHVSMKGDTSYSFNRVYDFNAALSFQTKMYGEYIPVFSKTTRIRHVFTPGVSLSYTPDFSNPVFGFYETYTYYDSNGKAKNYTYSPYERGMFGTAPGAASGMVSFNFENNLEMKMASEKDSTGFKKISLIDNLSVNFSNNLMADSLNWSDIAVNARFKFSKSFVVNIGAAFDPYMYGLNEYGNPAKINKLRISHGKGFGRLKSTGYSVSPSINQDTFKKLFGKDDDKEGSKKDEEQTSDTGSPGAEAGGQKRGGLLDKKKDDNQYDEDGYVKSEIKWNLAFNFSMNYNYGDFDYDKMEYRGRLTKNFGLNGSIQPTRNWNFNFNTGYDFDAKKIAHMSCNLTRNLHCWSITASFNPVGAYKSYYVSLRASSSLLQDLKYEQRGQTSSYDPRWD